MRTTSLFFILLAAFVFTASAHAVTIDMVTVGNPGNAPDPQLNRNSVGSVGYNYLIGKYEVTAGQYTEFLNAVAKADPNALYNTAMGNPPSFGLAPYIQRTGFSPNYTYSVPADWADRPVHRVSFWDAVRFANWLHNGQPTGPQGAATTEGGAYHDVGIQSLFGRNAGARFFIPTQDEWYKAAYHNKSAGLAATYFAYPTGTSAVPGNDITETTKPGNNANYYIGTNAAIAPPYHTTVVGEFELSGSPYGTFDQGGNVTEWNETEVILHRRGLRGGAWNDDFALVLSADRNAATFPEFESIGIGFRVASPIPEPDSLTLSVATMMALMLWRRKK